MKLSQLRRLSKVCALVLILCTVVAGRLLDLRQDLSPQELQSMLEDQEDFNSPGDQSFDPMARGGSVFDMPETASGEEGSRRASPQYSMAEFEAMLGDLEDFNTGSEEPAPDEASPKRPLSRLFALPSMASFRLLSRGRPFTEKPDGHVNADVAAQVLDFFRGSEDFPLSEDSSGVPEDDNMGEDNNNSEKFSYERPTHAALFPSVLHRVKGALESAWSKLTTRKVAMR